MLGVSGNILGSAVNLTTSEVDLGVSLRVERDSKSSSEVVHIALLVELDVLSGVNGSVSVDILEVETGLWLVTVDIGVLIWLPDLSRESVDWLVVLVILHVVVVSVVVVLATIIDSGADLELSVSSWSSLVEVSVVVPGVSTAWSLSVG